MRTLYLDLASHEGMIAAVMDERMVASESVDHRIDDSALIPYVEDVLKKAGWSYQDLTNIACVVGPGGFTSLRVAVALANALSHELRIPVCGMHLSDVYFARASAETSLRLGSGQALSPLTWFHSTKKHELFIRQNNMSASRCISVDALKGMLQKGMQWMGELIPEHRQIVVDSGAEMILLRAVEDVLPGFLKNQHYKRQILRPWYGRGW